MAPLLLALLVSSGALAAADGGPRISIADSSSSESSAPAGEASLAGVPGGDVMQQLLNWGIEHSDPERLKELMRKYEENNLTIKDVYGQDVIDALFVNEASIMQQSIKDISSFTNASVLDDDLEGALQTLRDHVEQVDNAGNLHRMGGLRPLLDLGAPSTDAEDADRAASAKGRATSIRAGALWTLGVAVQNNEPVQADLLSLDGLPRLLSQLAVCSGGSSSTTQEEEKEGIEYCSKLLFTISGLVRNNATTQAEADGLGLFNWLVDVGVPHKSASLAKKALGLLDISLAQNPELPFLDLLPQKQEKLASLLIQRIRGDGAGATLDLDAPEKVLRLVNRLLALRPMLFPSDFRSRLASAVSEVFGGCEREHGVGDELCTGLAGLARHADLALAAREITDDDL